MCSFSNSQPHTTSQSLSSSNCPASQCTGEYARPVPSSQEGRGSGSKPRRLSCLHGGRDKLFLGFTDAISPCSLIHASQLLSPWLCTAGWLKLFWAFLQVSLVTNNKMAECSYRTLLTMLRGDSRRSQRYLVFDLRHTDMKMRNSLEPVWVPEELHNPRYRQHCEGPQLQGGRRRRRTGQLTTQWGFPPPSFTQPHSFTLLRPGAGRALQEQRQPAWQGPSEHQEVFMTLHPGRKQEGAAHSEWDPHSDLSRATTPHAQVCSRGTPQSRCAPSELQHRSRLILLGQEKAYPATTGARGAGKWHERARNSSPPAVRMPPDLLCFLVFGV